MTAQADFHLLTSVMQRPRYLDIVRPTPTRPSPDGSAVSTRLTTMSSTQIESRFGRCSPPTPTASLYPVPPGMTEFSSCRSSCLTSHECVDQEAISRKATSPVRSHSQLDDQCNSQFVWYILDSGASDESEEEPSTPSEYHSVDLASLVDGRFKNEDYAFGGVLGQQGPESPRMEPSFAQAPSSVPGVASFSKAATIPTLFPTFGDFLPQHFALSTSDGCFADANPEHAFEVGQDNTLTELMSSFSLSTNLNDVRTKSMLGPSHPQSLVQDTLNPNATPFTPFQRNTRQSKHSHTLSSDSFTFHLSPMSHSSSLSSSPASPCYSTSSTASSLPLTPPRRASDQPSSSRQSPFSTMPMTPPRIGRLSLPAACGFGRSVTRSHSLETMYPLSEADTARIAALHGGRIPTIEQLAPPEAVAASANGAQPIINTGNQGPMVLQAGDWKCGVCAFVNWRRRKICMKCFPFASDVGCQLTINSHRSTSLTEGSQAMSLLAESAYMSRSRTYPLTSRMSPTATRSPEKLAFPLRPSAGIIGQPVPPRAPFVSKDKGELPPVIWNEDYASGFPRFVEPNLGSGRRMRNGAQSDSMVFFPDL